MTDIKIPEWERKLGSLALRYKNECNKRRSQINFVDEFLYKGIRDLMQAKQDCKSSELDDNGLPLKIVAPAHFMLSEAVKLQAYLTSVFAFRSPPFTVSNDPTNTDVTTAVKEKLKHDSSHGRWISSYIKTIQNAVLYNFAPKETTLDNKGRIRIKALSVHNTTVDPRCSVEHIHEQAGWAVTTEWLSMQELYNRLLKTREQNLCTLGRQFLDNPFLAGQLADNFYASGYGYMRPHYATSSILQGAAEGNLPSVMQHADKGIQHIQYAAKDRSSLAVTTLYLRAMPSWLELKDKRFAGLNEAILQDLPILKIVMVGSLPVSCSHVEECEGIMPISVGALRIDSDDEQPYTYTQLLAPAQVYMDKMDVARLHAIRKLLNMKAAYDPDVVDAATLQDQFVSIKRQADMNGNKEPLAEAFQLIQDNNFTAIQMLLGETGNVQAQGSRMVGSTAQMGGEHLRGNRTAAESQRITSLAEAPFRSLAMIFQETCVAVDKQLIATMLSYCTHTLLYMPDDDIVYRAVTPEQFKTARVRFEVSDGLTPSSKLVSPDAVANLLSTVAQVPALQQAYSLRSLFDTLAAAQGIDNLADIPTPQQDQAIRDGMLANGQAPVQQQVPTGTQQQAQQQPPAPQQ